MFSTNGVFSLLRKIVSQIRCQVRLTRVLARLNRERAPSAPKTPMLRGTQSRHDHKAVG